MSELEKSVPDLLKLIYVNMCELTQRTSIDPRNHYVNISLLHFV